MKEKLIAEDMQARLKAQLAEKQKKGTEQMIQLELENDDLRRKVEEQGRMLEIKESLISVLNSRKNVSM